MALTAGDLTSILAARIRDPEHTAISAADLRLMLTWGERITNAITERVIADFTLTIQIKNPIYDIHALVPDLIRIHSVRSGNRDIDLIPYRRLFDTSIDWFRRGGPEIKRAATFGRTLLIVHPLMKEATTVTVRYVQLTPALTAPEQLLTLPDEDHDTILGFAESFASLRRGRYQRVLEDAGVATG